MTVLLDTCGKLKVSRDTAIIERTRVSKKTANFAA